MCKRNAELNKQAMAMIKKQSEEPTANKKGEAEGKKKTPEELLKEQEENVKGKKVIDKDMAEALKIANDLERQEEEELMKKALEESERLAKQAKDRENEDEDEEMRMI